VSRNGFGRGLSSTIGEEFGRAKGGVTVSFNFAGSQQVVQQLSQGAPAAQTVFAEYGFIAPD
jgi:ABC-type molybdate transport system substrate-binding protein